MSDFAHYTDEALAETAEAVNFEQRVRSFMRPPPCMTFASLDATWWGEPCHLPHGHDGDHDFGTPEEIRRKRQDFTETTNGRDQAALAEALRRRGGVA